MKPTRLLRNVCVGMAAVIVTAAAVADSAAEPLPFDPVGARHVAMGAASAALWNGPGAVYHNPASLVWQKLTFGAGIQPVQFVEGPRSFWLHLYNKSSDYGIPVALIAQGWEYPSPEGSGRFYDAGLPVAFNLTDATPGAATVHLAFERRHSGTWKFGVPFDFGFLARHPSGATLGIVARGVTIGPEDFESFEQRVEYGASWGGGPVTLSSSMIWRKGDNWEDALDQYRVGGEIGGSARIHLLGGYIHEQDDWYATAGVALRSDKTARYEVVYSVVYNDATGGLSHFLQYALRMF
ncbi:MAG: hypothetical protein MAG453_02144 [Calditrichaeota bacterium]|nr:hypothetical protein [Calditrichota bacterium]